MAAINERLAALSPMAEMSRSPIGKLLRRDLREAAARLRGVEQGAKNRSARFPS